MKYFDGIAAANFKRGSDGNLLYFPNGSFGKGYIVPNEEMATSLRRRIKLIHLLTLPGLLLLNSIAPMGIMVAMAAFAFVGIQWSTSRAVSSLAISEERLTYAELQQNLAIATPYWLLGIFTSVSAVWAIFSLFVLYSRPTMIVPGSVSLLFAAVCLFIFIRMHIFKKRILLPSQQESLFIEEAPLLTQKMTWKVYFVVYSIILLILVSDTNFSDATWNDIIDEPTTLVSILGLWAFAFQRRVLTKEFWKVWFCWALIWDAINNFVFDADWIEKFALDFSQSPSKQIIIGILLALLLGPLYIALYKYAFRSESVWKQQAKTG